MYKINAVRNHNKIYLLTKSGSRDMSLIPRKRNRKILVCSNCRAKKNKCDRETPCGLCARLGLGDTCVYDLSKQSPSPSSSTKQNFSETFDFPVQRSLGGEHESNKIKIPRFEAVSDVCHIYPYLPIHPKDPATKLIWSFWAFQIRDFQYTHFSLSRHLLGLSLSKVDELERKLNLENTIPYKSVDTGKIKINETKTKISRFGEDLGLSYYPDYKDYNNSTLLQKIKKIFPSQRQLIRYQKVFFEKFCTHVPVLDEYEHFTNMTRIFNILNSADSSGDRIQKLNIELKHDFMVLAHVLFILRIVYVYYLSNDKLNPADQPIYLEAISLAEECMHTHGLLNQPTLALLQALLLCQFYRYFAPERQHGFLSDQILRSKILETCYCIGLNRDSQCFDLETVDFKLSHLRRKIWYHVFQSNIYHSATFLFIERHLNHDFDAQWPQFDIGLSNHRNPIYEKYITDRILLDKPILENLDRLLQYTQRIKPTLFERDVLDFITKFDNLIATTLGTYEQIDSLPADHLKIHRLKTFIKLKCFLVMFAYSSFLKYDEEMDYPNAMICLDHCLRCLFVDLGKITLDIREGGLKRYGDSFRLLVTPLLVEVFHLTICICEFLMVRIKCTTMLDSSDSELTAKYNQWSEKLKKFAMVRLKYMIVLASFSHSCNKLLKINLINLLVAFDEEGIYKLVPEQLINGKLYMQPLHVENFIKLLKPAWHTVERERIDSMNIFSVADILKHDPKFEAKIVRYITADKIWVSTSILNMFQENSVPKDDDNEYNNEDDIEFTFRRPNYHSMPGFRGSNGLLIE